MLSLTNEQESESDGVGTCRVMFMLRFLVGIERGESESGRDERLISSMLPTKCFSSMYNKTRSRIIL